MQLKDLVQKLNNIWPVETAEEWDRVGLSVGRISSLIKRTLVTVDVTMDVIEEAKARDCQLILSHHPLLLKPVNTLADDSTKGSLVSALIEAKIASFGAHTNADVSVDGATYQLAKRLDLQNLKSLVSKDDGLWHGIYGEFIDSRSLESVAASVAASVPRTSRGVAFTGSPETKVKTVALCSGAGDSYIGDALAINADLFISGDLRHHLVQDAIEFQRDGAPMALMDVSHWAFESLWVEVAVQKLETIDGVEFIASALNTDPWTGVKN